jgi:hypothetical protein
VESGTGGRAKDDREANEHLSVSAPEDVRDVSGTELKCQGWFAWLSSACDEEKNKMWHECPRDKA